MTRRFELVEGGSSKFWEITLAAASFTVRYGRIGTSGQTQTKSFAGDAQAIAAASKLVAEKTGKGYVEVAPDAAGSAPEAALPAGKAEKAKPAEGETAKETTKAAADKPTKAEKVAKAAKPAKAEKVAKGEKKEVPSLTVGSKTLGARALANAAERLAAATTAEAFREASGKITYSDYELTKTLLHLLTHGLFAPTHRVHVRALRGAYLTASPEVAIPSLSALGEPLVETLRTELPIVTQYVPVLSRLHRLAPEALRAAALPPTLARVAALIRALAGESLGEAEGAGATGAVAEMLPYGENAIVVVDAEDRCAPVDPDALAAALSRISGPHWVRAFPKPESLPTAVASVALRDESLEEVGRVLSLFNKKILDPRSEPPARFFEVAETLSAQKATFMRAAGIRRAAQPSDIPAGGEDLLEPMDVYDDAGFARLGTERLDAWAKRWLARFPNALTEREAAEEGYSIGTGLRHLVLLGIPFSEPVRRELIGLPRPYAHAPDKLDIREYVEWVRFIREQGARELLPLFAQMAREHEEHEEEAIGLRLAVAAAVRALPEGAEIPEAIDDLLSLGDPRDYDSERVVREAVSALPTLRGEQVIARTAHLLKDPFEELTYARQGATDVGMRRLARLVAAGREDERMWSSVRSLHVLGAAFGPILAQALAGETLSDSFLSRLEGAIDAEALDHLKAAVGDAVLDLSAEMKRLTAELGGEHTVVYVLSTGSAGDGLSRVGGLPAGFAPGDAPRHRGRKLVHAFSVDLEVVPELGARYPGARTLSVWVQGYSEDSERAQAILPRTEAEVMALPATGGAPLELRRLEVPRAIFESELSERAAYARHLLYQKAGYLLGGPLWLQDGPRGLDPSFIGQYDERVAAGVNLGDMGICYAFADRALFQCH